MYRLPTKWKENPFFRNAQQHPLAWAIGAYVALLSALCLWKLWRLGYTALDLGIFSNILYNTTHGSFFGSSIHPPSYLGDHFAPLLLLFWPLYALFSHSAVLLIGQSTIIGLAAWPLHRLARQYLPGRWSLAVAVAWFLNPFVLNANLFEFHTISLVPFFLFWAILFYVQKKFWPFLAACALCLLVREDVALLVIPFSLVSLLDKRSLRWKITPLALGGTYFLLAMKIIGSFSAAGGYKFLLYYSWLGSGWAEMGKNILLAPQRVGLHFLRPQTVFVTLAALLPFGFLPIIRLRYLALAALVFVQFALMSGGIPAATVSMHYMLLFLPALFWALAAGLAEAFGQGPAKSRLVGFLRRRRPLVPILLAVCVAYSFFALGPVSEAFVQNNSLYETTERRARKELIATIPSEASVAASAKALTEVSARKEVMLFRYLYFGRQQYAASPYRPENPDYLLLDFTDFLDYEANYRSNSALSKHYPAASENLKRIMREGGYGVVGIADSLVLYKKGGSQEFLARQHSRIPPMQTFLNEPVGDSISLLGYDVLEGGPLGPQLALFWRATRPSSTDMNFEIAQTPKGEGEAVVTAYPFGYGMYPSSSLLPGKVVETRHPLRQGSNEVEVRGFFFRGNISLGGMRGAKLEVLERAPAGEPVSLGTILVRQEDEKN